ncbi:MAG: putative acyl-CoA dehydrogenase FadE10 [Chlamydiae bacterium]|nr:putative acyl-CoA dehydrogenase FadE10 [Chlamydiota bacterium]
MDHDLLEKEAAEETKEIAEEARDFAYRLPSFAGQLFMGKFDADMLFPFPQQDPRDKELGDEYIARVEKLLQEELDPDEVDRTREIPMKFRDEMAKIGMFAMKVPKDYNGLGFSQTNYNRTIMKVASYCGSTAVLLSAHQSIGVPQPLKFYGTEEQKRKYFPRFRQGAISAFALTETGAGSDPARMQTEAKLSEDGSHYVLNGEKLWCTNGTIANVIIVVSKTAPKMIKGKERQQITAFILEMDTPGVEIVHRCEFMGLHGIYNGLLRFTNVKIPVEDRLGDEGRGLAMALDTINVGRLTLPAASAGVAKQCLSIARRWGAERVQWGMPIGLHEAGRVKLAYIASTTFAIDAVSWLTSQWQDQGEVDIRIEAAMAKMFTTEALWTITDLTLQLRGGRGYETARSLKARGEDPFPVERVMRDCRINTILEGSTEIMHLFLTREAMDPHLKRISPLIKGEFQGSDKFKYIAKLFGHYSCWYMGQTFKSFTSSSYPGLEDLERHFKFIEKTSHLLARKIFIYMAIYQKKLEHKQMLLGRLIDIGTDLFIMAATCSYAISESKNQKNNSPIELADHFCQVTKRRIKENFAAITDNDDRSTNRIAKKVIDNDFRWLEKGIMWIGPVK